MGSQMISISKVPSVICQQGYKCVCSFSQLCKHNIYCSVSQAQIQSVFCDVLRWQLFLFATQMSPEGCLVFFGSFISTSPIFCVSEDSLCLHTMNSFQDTQLQLLGNIPIRIHQANTILDFVFLSLKCVIHNQVGMSVF